MNEIKAIIFDLDGTLIDSMYVWRKIDIDFLAERGLKVPPDYEQAIKTMHFETAAEYTIARFGFKETPQEIMSIWLNMALNEYAHNVRLKDNAEELLKRLKTLSVKIGIATSSKPILAEPVLKNNGVYDCFDMICYTSEVGLDKRHPDLYLPRSWEILWNKGKRYNSEWFRFIYNHRNELIKQNGEKVQTFIIQVLFHQIYPYMIFERVYDKDFISEVEQKVRDLNFNSLSWEQLLAMCNILHLRQEKKYGEMLDLWGKIVPNLPNETLKIKYDVTLGRLQDMSEAEKKQAIAYLEGRMKGMGQSLLAKYRHIVTELSDYQGILFETDGLQKALAKARKENNLQCSMSCSYPYRSLRVFPEFAKPHHQSFRFQIQPVLSMELVPGTSY
mgnify:CR=1 FL=1